MRTRFFTLFFLPTFFPPSPIHVTLRHPEVLGNVFSSVSLLIQISTAFSFSNTVSIYTQNSSSLLHMYCTSFLSLLGLSSPIQMQRRPHRLFVSSILEVAIHARFSFQQRVGDRKLNSVCALRTCTLDLGSFFYRRAVNAPHSEPSRALSHQHRQIQTRTSCRDPRLGLSWAYGGGGGGAAEAASLSKSWRRRIAP